MKAIKPICNVILAVLFAASFAVCTDAQAKIKPWTKPLLISSQKVEAAYKHSMPIPDLTDGLSGGAEYRVKVGWHTGPKAPGIHMRDTDIFYVTSGEATLVVGGTVVDAHPTAKPFVWRGTKIQGGTIYHLKKGDIMIIPRGVPFEYKKIPVSPYRFLLVKVI